MQSISWTNESARKLELKTLGNLKNQYLNKPPVAIALSKNVLKREFLQF